MSTLKADMMLEVADTDGTWLSISCPTLGLDTSDVKTSGSSTIVDYWGISFSGAFAN
jgi:hypothetical protein